MKILNIYELSVNFYIYRFADHLLQKSHKAFEFKTHTADLRGVNLHRVSQRDMYTRGVQAPISTKIYIVIMNE